MRRDYGDEEGLQRRGGTTETRRDYRDEEGLQRCNLELLNTKVNRGNVLKTHATVCRLVRLFFSSSPLALLSVHCHPLPHLKYESEGSFSPTPMPG